MLFVRLFVIALIVFLMLDAVWLGFVARTFYRNQLGDLLTSRPNWWAAAVFYLMFVFGMIVFVIEPSVHAGSIGKAALLGALFGLITYGTYDLTNQATISKWPLLVTVVDMTWGTVLAATVCSVTCGINRLMSPTLTG